MARTVMGADNVHHTGADTGGSAHSSVPVPEWFGVGSDDVSMGAQLGLGVLR
jgi:hypothetical protein